MGGITAGVWGLLVVVVVPLPRAPRTRDPEPPPPLTVSDPSDCGRAAAALATGAVVGQAFANFYVMTTRPDAATVRAVNLLKGRPPDQVGSITTTPSRIPDVWDWSRLPAGLTRREVLDVVDALYVMGPFGFRGPAAGAVPDHLTSPDAGVRTAQVIAPGYRCPSNDFLARALRATGAELLYITSANRSRHLSGAPDEPAHFTAEGLRQEFGSDVLLLEHPDEAAARAAYPGYLPMSTTILAFHVLGPAGADGRRSLVLERHGSLHVDAVRAAVRPLGLDVVLGAGAVRRLALRTYEPVAVAR